MFWALIGGFGGAYVGWLLALVWQDRQHARKVARQIDAIMQSWDRQQETMKAIMRRKRW